MLPSIKKVVAKATKFWTLRMVTCGRRCANSAVAKPRKVAKAFRDIKDYTVRKTVKFCDYLAENEIPTESIEFLKRSYGGQSLIEVDYTISEEPGEPVESIFQKARCLWKWLFNDSFFIFRRVKRRIRKMRKVSKRDIRALDEDEILEALVIALKAGNVAFIAKAIKLRDFPKSFINEALHSGNETIIKIVANRYPELSNCHWVLTRLAKAREFEICYKVLEHIEYLEKYHEPFIKVLIRRTDVNDYEGWQVLDFLIKEKKIKESTLRALFRKEVDASCCRNFEEWRTSRRSATFLFIYFVV